MKKLIKIALFVGLIILVAKTIEAKKSEWQGLSESDLRDKLNDKMKDRVPEDKREEVADKIVTTMRDKGWVAEEQATPAS